MTTPTPEAFDLIAEIFTTAEELRSGELSHTDVANWLLDLDELLHTEPPPELIAAQAAEMQPARSASTSTQDLQEIILAEREGAELGRGLVEAGSRVIGLLGSAIRRNPEIAAAILSGYAGVMLDNIPNADPRQFVSIFFSQVKDVDKEIAADILERTLRRLECRREDSQLDRDMRAYDEHADRGS